MFVGLGGFGSPRAEEAGRLADADSRIVGGDQLELDSVRVLGDVSWGDPQPHRHVAHLAGSDVEAIKAGLEDLTSTSQAFTQKLYEATASEGAGQYDASTGAGATSADDDDVVDAEVIDDEDAS